MSILTCKGSSDFHFTLVKITRFSPLAGRVVCVTKLLTDLDYILSAVGVNSSLYQNFMCKFTLRPVQVEQIR